MNSQEKINGQAIACNEVSNLIAKLRWGSNGLEFAYTSNRYATVESKKAFNDELDRISNTLARRSDRLLARLASIFREGK